jgi:hypothetical protein
VKQQTASEYKVISRWGCYFASLIYEAERITGKESTPEFVLNLYSEAVCSGLMGWNCYIMKPGKLLSLALHDLNGNTSIGAKYVGWWNDDFSRDDYTSKDGHFWNDNTYDFAILRYDTKYGYHFTSEGYNPDKSLKLLKLSGKRFFKIGG